MARGSALQSSKIDYTLIYSPACQDLHSMKSHTERSVHCI